MKEIPQRKDIPNSDKWNLDSLFTSPTEWEKGYNELKEALPSISKYKGSLGTSVETLVSFLNEFTRLSILDERLGYYSLLKISEDEGSDENNAFQSRYMNISSQFNTVLSFFTPEIQSIPEESMQQFMESPLLKEYRIFLFKLLRYKPHILSEKEERLLAMQAESAATAQKAFSSLSNVDMKFGSIKTPEGEVPLSNTTFGSLLKHKDRQVRETTYKQFYQEWDKHKNTVASLYNGSIQQDIYQSKARNFPSARAQSLFGNDVPEKVYDNLLSTVEENLPALHDYYDLRKKMMGVEKLMHYDVYAPLIDTVEKKTTYDEAIEIICKAVQPLGKEYTENLKKGLTGGWVDKYENQGKRSGAFSAGSFTGKPYILLNYKQDDIRWLFTMIHEAGHSMHSFYSCRNNPFQHYNYTIFEAEVASTFNEQLLADYLYKNATSNEEKAYLIGKQLDDIIATIYRQTMFATYESGLHNLAEQGQPLTVNTFRKEYNTLLQKYFGAEVGLLECSDLEGLRIPHFYRAFYVYKYATGLSAAIALSQKVLNGGDSDREDYLSFLKSGGSKFPLESLKLAGVDMSSPAPVEAALKKFASLVKELKSLTNFS